MTEGIKVFVQNSIRINTEKGNVYVDPFEMKAEPHDAAFILVTHEHFDHFSPESIEKVANKNTVLVVPENMLVKSKDASKFVSEIVTVKPDEKRTINWLELETVPAYNINKKFHPKAAGWVGYIVIADGKRIFIAGDTDATPEALNVKCDVALVPIGGTYTMDSKEAAELINVIKPAAAIPVHYGKVVGSMDDGKDFANLVKAPIRVQIEIK